MRIEKEEEHPMLDPPSTFELLVGGISIVALALLANKARAIDGPGALVGAIITSITFVAGGIRWLLLIVAFFVTSSLLTRFHYDYKRKLGSAQEKGGTRSWPNTIANGGVPAIIAIVDLFNHQNFLIIAFLASIAAATSDTIATEIGLLSRSKPRLITRPSRLVEPGTSGGVTALGEVVSVGSALGIAVLGTLLSVIGRSTAVSFGPAAVSIVLGGVFGSTFDSLLGASVQANWRCAVCGALTENRNHHGKSGVLVKGSRFVDNNVVNFFGILAGVAISLVVDLAITSS